MNYRDERAPVRTPPYEDASGAFEIGLLITRIQPPNKRRKCHLKSCGARPVVWERGYYLKLANNQPGRKLLSTVWCAGHRPGAVPALGVGILGIDELDGASQS